MTPETLLATCPDTPGAYLHVPFCSEICPYCPYDKVRHEPHRAARYFEALSVEVDRWLPAVREPFTSLYVGGGTPTLCLDHLGPIVERLPVAGERAIEILPSHVTDPTVHHLTSLGFDFASVGVQSFDTDVLAHLGRRGDRELHRRAVALAVRHFACVDVDLIFDVAFQRPEVFLDDLRTCLELGAHQVSTYPLMRFGYTPFGKARHAARQEHELLRRAEELAARHGYVRRSVWTFGRDAAAAYTSITRELYVGFGASAASFLGRWFTINHFSPERYAEALLAGRLPHARAWELPAWAAALYWTFWQAYVGRVDLDRLDALFDHPRLARLVLAGLTAVGGGHFDGHDWSVTPRGRDWYHDVERWVTYHYIEPVWEDLMREHASVDRPSGLPARPSRRTRLQRRLPLLPS